MPYSYYGYYDHPGYASYGSYRYQVPEVTSSPAFQWGYSAASQYASRLPKRHRRALSVQPGSAVSSTAKGLTVQYGSQSAEYPSVYATPRQRRAAIDNYWRQLQSPYDWYRGPEAYYETSSVIKNRVLKKLEEIEFSDTSEPIVAPVSLSSIRSRLLAACDLNDGAKRLYERHIKEVENVGDYNRKF